MSLLCSLQIFMAILNNLTFSNNEGSMFLLYSTLVFSGTVMFENNRGMEGGALTLVQSTLLFDSENNSMVSILSNTATYGGGIFLSQSELQLFSSSIVLTGNTASISGGGIYAYQSQTTISAKDLILFSKNSALEEGGAMIMIASLVYTFSMAQ